MITPPCASPDLKNHSDSSRVPSRRTPFFEELRSSNLSSLMTFEILLVRVLRDSSEPRGHEGRLQPTFKSATLNILMRFDRREVFYNLPLPHPFRMRHPQQGAGAHCDASIFFVQEISPRLCTGTMALSQPGDALSAGSEWFIRTTRIRRTRQSSSKQV